MSEREVGPLPPALQRLVEAERERTGLPPAALDRVATRLAGSVVAIPLDTSWVRRWLATRAGSIGIGFIAGAVAGGGAVSVLRKQPAPPFYADARSPTPPPPRQDFEPRPLAPAPEVSRAVTEPARPPKSLGRRGASPAPESPVHAAEDRDLELAAERAPLETARTALARGNADAALRALDEHERAFRRGRLVEEREALRVQALVKAARFDEARRRGREFLQKFPGSFLTPAVNAALREAR